MYILIEKAINLKVRILKNSKLKSLNKKCDEYLLGLKNNLFIQDVNFNASEFKLFKIAFF